MPKFCIRCGAALKPDAKFCVACGNRWAARLRRYLLPLIGHHLLRRRSLSRRRGRFLLRTPALNAV